MNSIVTACVASALLLVGVGARAQTPAPTASGPITVVTILDVVPNYAMANNVEASTALLDKLTADTQTAPGLISFKVLRDPNRPNHFLIIGNWKDTQSFDQYSGAASTRAFRQDFQPRQGGPFDERTYVSLK